MARLSSLAVVFFLGSFIGSHSQAFIGSHNQDCQDKLPESQCMMFAHLCYTALNMRQNCAKTCGLCNDQCASGPCLNGATCVDGALDYTYFCHCAAGYDGPTCGQVCKNDYSDDYCSKFAYICDPSLFIGDSFRNGCRATCGLCDFVDNLDSQCASDPCLNGGGCEEGIDSYTCHCAQGYGGTNCEIVTDSGPCASGPCLNGATCNNGDFGDTYFCHCAAGYDGATCGQVCKNDYSDDYCSKFAYLCDPSLFIGESFRNDGCRATCGLCDFVDNLDSQCASDPCLNGGGCEEGIDSYTCHCAQGYGGTNCEIVDDGDQCASGPCFNGATCEDGFLFYTCHCAAPYYGINCDKVCKNDYSDDYCSKFASNCNPHITHSDFNNQCKATCGVCDTA